ncbi:MAG TPA: hypothetical protein VH639_13375 [Bryobacteraceae bacterium]|jgi:hypothetical protein
MVVALTALVAIGLGRNVWSVRWWVEAAEQDRENIAELRALEERLRPCEIIPS